MRSESGDGKELGFWLEVKALFGTCSMLFPQPVLLWSCSGWNALMCGEGDWVGALVREVNAGGEVCWRGSGKIFGKLNTFKITCLVPGPVPCMVEVKRCLERTLQRESWLSVSRFGEGGSSLGGLHRSPI